MASLLFSQQVGYVIPFMAMLLNQLLAYRNIRGCGRLHELPWRVCEKRGTLVLGCNCLRSPFGGLKVIRGDTLWCTVLYLNASLLPSMYEHFGWSSFLTKEQLSSYSLKPRELSLCHTHQ
jgi:hypothetical protein